jgi:hypothetical protein
MIRYSLTCADGHRFESWFQSADAFDGLAEKGLLSCTVCGTGAVRKAVMAPTVASRESDAAPTPGAAPARAKAPAAPGPLRAPAHPAEAMLRALRDHLTKNSTYVGGRFAQEARAMHLGETEERPIHGEARPDEAKALIEEGIPIAPLPILPPDKSN